MDRLLDAFFRHVVKHGALTVVTAGGLKRDYGDGTGTPVRIRFTSRLWQTAVVLDPGLRCGEAYMRGGLLVEQGSIADFLEIAIGNLAKQRPSAWHRWLDNARGWLRRAFHANSRSRAERNAKHHYDRDQRLYDLFLDQDRQYSCAYFEDEHCSLEEAQQAKKRHIAAKLHLHRSGLNVLDIGCGWGGLGLYLAQSHRSRVVGINVASEQIAKATERLMEARQKAKDPLQCEFREQDYRSLPTTEKFDRIVSVGMFEHVGKRYYRSFFRKCSDLLNEDGVMLLHTVGRIDGPSETNPWVWRYIFPGGYTPALSELAPAIEQSGLILSDLEILRHRHYAETLRHWRMRFIAQRDRVLRLFGEQFLRMWEFYFAAFEAAFRHQGLVVFQLQLVKNADAVPFTRDYIYGSDVERRGAAGGRPAKYSNASPLRLV